MGLVVDASIVVPCFVPERFGEAAHRWIGSAQRLLAPDLLILEVGNILRMQARRGEITHP